MAFLLSPKPGAFTATILSSNCSQSCWPQVYPMLGLSTSSAMINNGRPVWTAFSKIGTISCTLEIFIVDQDQRIVIFRSHIFCIGNEVWRQIASVKLHSDHFIYISICSFCFFYVMTPSLVTLSSHPLSKNRFRRHYLLILMLLVWFAKIRTNYLTLRFEISNNCRNCFIVSLVAWFKFHYIFHPCIYHCLCQYGSSCSTITRCISKFLKLLLLPFVHPCFR